MTRIGIHHDILMVEQFASDAIWLPPVPLFRQTQQYAATDVRNHPMETRCSQRAVLFLIDSLSAEPYSR